MSLAKKFMKQKMMRQVLISLIPVSLMSIYLFGWRMLLLLAFVTVAGVLSEYGVMYLIQKDKTKVSEAVFVSCLLYTLTPVSYTHLLPTHDYLFSNATTISRDPNWLQATFRATSIDVLNMSSIVRLFPHHVPLPAGNRPLLLPQV